MQDESGCCYLHCISSLRCGHCMGTSGGAVPACRALGSRGCSGAQCRTGLVAAVAQ